MAEEKQKKKLIEPEALLSVEELEKHIKQIESIQAFLSRMSKYGGKKIWQKKNKRKS